ncbi:MAG: ABC transporter permease subunit [Deltaproteobacteria bacterium]|nr:ABC transporter permease subunit [Deltaproteobacteria bacterium]
MTAVVVDPRRTHVATLREDGTLRVLDWTNGSTVLERELLAGGAALVAPLAGSPGVAGIAADGRAVIAGIDWRVSYPDGIAEVTPAVASVMALEVETRGAAPRALSARLDPGGATLVVALDDGSLSLVQVAVDVNDFTGEREETVSATRISTPAPLDHLALAPEDAEVFASASDGRIFWWEVEDGTPVGMRQARSEAPVTALEPLIGGRALLAGRSDGVVDVWFALSRGRAGRELVHVRRFDGPGGAIGHLAGSPRGRSFLAAGAGGSLGLYHSTAHRELWTGHTGSAISALAWAPKANAAAIASARGLERLRVDAPHPEAGLASYFSRVWYEGHPEPEFIWQSTGGSDEFEPKLSLVPLVTGTLKGTIYAMLLAIPLGVLGALYTSQFMAPSLQRVVKPTVELMASLPSVVLGFLAGLWLAPRLEAVLPGMLLLLPSLPVAVLLAGAAWRALPARWTLRFQGGEILFQAVAISGVVWLCVRASPAIEAALFGGSFATWLHATTGLEYDQRNAIVAGIAMGFAVIPIIFAISEDAVSNVPRSLSAASLALGATPWQTMVRVVLPAASPGIFAAVMIGFGRAIGETMIVLMATGNTPLLDWSPFNGFRTLSANIAVEIPEAPHGGTLYRTLFVSATLLFALTFAINGAAELVRERLRRRFSGA